MNERGVFAVDRGIFDHPIFAPEPYTEREAWLWLVGAAVWADKRVRANKAMIDLKRGQLAFPIEFYARRFQWHVSRVRRFLKRIEADGMVLISATRHATHITICNYDKYAFGRRTSDALTDDQGDEQATNKRRQEEEPKKDNNKEIDAQTRERSPQPDDGWPEDFREQFWNCYPNKVGKPKALTKLEGIRKRGVLVPFEALMAGLDRYIRDKPPDRQWLNPETFLNQERWADQPAIITTSFGGVDAQTDNNRSSVNPLRSVPGKGGGLGRLRANLRAGQPPG